METYKFISSFNISITYLKKKHSQFLSHNDIVPRLTEINETQTWISITYFHINTDGHTGAVMDRAQLSLLISPTGSQSQGQSIMGVWSNKPRFVLFSTFPSVIVARNHSNSHHVCMYGMACSTESLELPGFDSSFQERGN